MTLHALSQLTSPKTAGAKAFALSELLRAGFPVPDGFSIGSEVFQRVLEQSGKARAVTALLTGLTAKNAARAGEALRALADTITLPDDLLHALERRVRDGVSYAVRSSGTCEDLEGFSFAGQYDTVLQVRGIRQIAAAIITCWRSMYSESVLTYLANRGQPAGALGMGVIIQEMVQSEQSGVAFTVNPMTGADTEILIEATAGQGEQLVSGKVKAEQYGYDWFLDCSTHAGGSVLSAAQVKQLAKMAQRVQLHFGYPCDIEFAFEKGELFLLQARPITKLQYSGIPDQWTTADFKDGGVSATVCRPYMWSLYEYIWENEFKRFLLEGKILKSSQLRPLGKMFCSRPYWNLTVAKTAMSAVPGYRERDFDSELGVAIPYEGDGQITKVTPGTLWRILRMALAQKKILKKRRRTAQSLKDGLLQTYEDYRSQADAPCEDAAFKEMWRKLVFEDYLHSEGTYFWQIFMNTIHQSLFRDKIRKHTSQGGYFRLIGGLDNISHLLPFYDMWDISRAIRADSDAFAYWQNTPSTEIDRALSQGETICQLDRVRDHIARYGYHSEKELDVAWPCFYEDTLAVVRAISDTVALGEDCSPLADRARLQKAFTRELAGIQRRISPKQFRRLEKTVQDMRELLWWREEFRDVSTRFYYLIRIYTLRLAEILTREGTLSQPEDIWFAKIDDLRQLLCGTLPPASLGRIVERNRRYYQSFRNFLSENEIGCAYVGATKAQKSAGLHGIGCSCGTVTGTARVISSLAETHRLREGDILITRFTDTGWTSKFALLKGIVTEYGGILCHAAIVSREYGIPCVVCADNVTREIPDGAAITINGETGEIFLHA